MFQFAFASFMSFNPIFEAEADKQLPPPPSAPENESNCGGLKNSYWKNFCGEIKNFKVNFKNYLLVVGRSLVKLICSVGNSDFGFISNILKGISGYVRRLGQVVIHLDNLENQLINGKAAMELRLIMLNRMPLVCT